MKFGSKRAIFGVLRGLDLVWELATPPTHIWERSPKKNFFLRLPYLGYDKKQFTILFYFALNVIVILISKQ